MRRIAIIPARSGSKGLLNKNVLPLLGKPLMAYTIEAALQSNCFDVVFVSTDSQVYADVAIQYGANASFLRSRDNASDIASTWDVVREVIARFRECRETFDVITLLQPTSPLRNIIDIQNAMKLFDEMHANFVESVCEMEHSPLWSNTLDETLSLKDFIKPEYNMRRQQLPKYYRKNGAIFIIRADNLEGLEYLYSDGSYAYIMPLERSIDIDNKFDMQLAELLMNQKMDHENNRA